jgi:hypothetical protein
LQVERWFVFNSIIEVFLGFSGLTRSV